MTRRTKGGPRWALVFLALTPLAAPVAAQQEQIPGVTLGLTYTNDYLPALAIKPFTGSFGGQGVASQVEGIVANDLRLSDHFEVLDSLPAGIVGAEAVDYTLWDRLGAVWLVSGQVEGAGEGFVLVLQLHDVVYGEMRDEGRFQLPRSGQDDFRMAVHRTSDQIVEWATGEPGMAATRITFTMRDAEGVSEVYVIDSDGENLRRVSSHGNVTASPTWSMDGSRIAFTSWKSGYPRIYEVDEHGGGERMLPAVRGPGDYITPAYHPDGRTLAFSVMGANERGGIFTYDLDRDCCLSYLSGGDWYDLGPTFSPDGLWLAFNTLRFGDAQPQVMLMRAEGGSAETLSPYEYGGGGFFTAPDWSPRGDLVAFTGRIERRGRYHILVADVADRGRVLRQLTFEGNNEDPSWAPDGRHLVFSGERSWGFGLLVVDVVTGRIRPLLAGRRVGPPDWSPVLEPR